MLVIGLDRVLPRDFGLSETFHPLFNGVSVKYLLNDGLIAVYGSIRLASFEK